MVDFGNILLNVLIVLILRMIGYETINKTLKCLRHIEILTLLTVLFLFSAPSLVPEPSISNPSNILPLQTFMRTPMWIRGIVGGLEQKPRIPNNSALAGI